MTDDDERVRHTSRESDAPESTDSDGYPRRLNEPGSDALLLRGVLASSFARAQAERAS